MNGQQVWERRSASLPLRGSRSKPQRDATAPLLERLPSTRRQQQAWERLWGRGTLTRCWWDCELVQPLWKTAWRLLRTVRIQLPHDPATPLPGVHLKHLKTSVYRDMCTPVLIAASVTVAKTRTHHGVLR